MQNSSVLAALTAVKVGANEAEVSMKPLVKAFTSTRLKKLCAIWRRMRDHLRFFSRMMIYLGFTKRALRQYYNWIGEVRH